MINQALTPGPTPPHTGNPVTFPGLADAWVAWFTEVVIPELSAVVDEFNDEIQYLQSLGAAGFPMTFSTSSIADVDPGAGVLRLNNLTQTAATIVRIDNGDANGASIAALVASFGVGTSGIKGVLTIAHRDQPSTKYLKFNVTAVATPAGYSNVTGSCVAFSGANPLAHGDPLVVTFVRTADTSGGGIGSSDLQNQTYTYFTTAGTSTAYTLTPTPALLSRAPGARFDVKFHVACGANPTLNVSGLGAVQLVRQLADGTYGPLNAGEIPANHYSPVRFFGTAQAVVETMPFAPGSLVGVQVLTATGTYTPHAAMRTAVVDVQGAGGAGGGVAASGASNYAIGGGGGAGSFARGRFTRTEIGASVAVTIGAGGVGAASASGPDGGTSSFGALLSAPGGRGGAGNTGGGGASSATFQTLGGTWSDAPTGTALVAMRGQQGGNALNTPSTPVSGAGGSSVYGTGGPQTAGGTVVGTAGSGYGAGGSGASSINGGAARAGGNGAPGVVIVWEYA